MASVLLMIIPLFQQGKHRSTARISAHKLLLWSFRVVPAYFKMLMESILVVKDLTTMFTTKFRMLNPSVMGFHVPGHLCLSGGGKLTQNTYKIGELMKCFLVLDKTLLRSKNFLALLTFEAFFSGVMADVMGFTFVVFPE